MYPEQVVKISEDVSKLIGRDVAEDNEIDYDKYEYIFIEILSEYFFDKFIKGENLSINLLLDNPAEFDLIIQKMSTYPVLESLKDKGIFNSYKEDDFKLDDEKFFLSEKGKIIKKLLS